MLTSVNVKNFRAFSKLTVGKLGRINLVTGLNNSGKTSLLEACFLLSGGSPDLALKVNAFRGMDSVSGSSDAVVAFLWMPLFNGFDSNRPIEISGTHEYLGSMKLQISLKRRRTIELDLGSKPKIAEPGIPGDKALEFAFSGESMAKTWGQMRTSREGIEIDQPSGQVPYISNLLSDRSGNHRQDAVRLGRLRQQKMANALTTVLQIVEPRLRSIEDISASGNPMIWGDVGLSELVPLPAMGEGMTRIARLVLSICEARKGLVLVDEIENGLHHSILPDVWKAIESAAEEFECQILATTHSFECVEAAAQSVSGDNLCLHRIELDENGGKCVTYESGEVMAAIEHRLEVR